MYKVGMDNSSDTVLTKKSYSSFAVSICTAAIFLLYKKLHHQMQNHVRNKMAASIRKFVGGMTAKICPNLQQGLAKNREEN